MKLLNILLLPVRLPYVVYVFARVIAAKGWKGGAEHVEKARNQYEKRMALLDALIPPGSYTHKRAVREAKKYFRKQIKEAYVKKS